MKQVAILLSCMILSGCGGLDSIRKSMTPRYEFSLVKPVESSNLSYTDQKIKIEFSLKYNPYRTNVEGFRQYERYEELAFVLTNLTDQVIIIEWDKVSFEDTAGYSGNSVMHKGIKYNECSNMKPPSSIPPHGRMADVIIPCNAVNLDINKRWDVSLFPSPRKMPTITFGVLFPLRIGNDTATYEFKFTGQTEK